MRKLLVILSAVLIIGAAAGLWYFLMSAGVRIGGYYGEPIEEIGNDPAIKSFPPEAVQKNKDRLADLEKILKAAPADFDAWMDVGQLKKFFHNYKGAVQAYEYAATLNPDSPLAYYNLANLYGLYLGEYAKAEQYYEQAIEKGWNLAYTYLGLAEFYRTFYKDKFRETEKVLLRGLEVIPDDPNLMLDLAFYYKTAGDKEKAVSYFKKLLNHPDISGAQKQALEEEMKLLR
jgi:tetratricopeptide (TPR) repeat protein